MKRAIVAVGLAVAALNIAPVQGGHVGDGVIYAISIELPGHPPAGYAIAAAPSEDGDVVSFLAQQEFLSEGQNGSCEFRGQWRTCAAPYVWRQGRVSRLVPEANNVSESPVISGDGRVAAFVSLASNLVPNDQNEWFDIFSVAVSTGSIRRISGNASGGGPLHGPCGFACGAISLSHDGSRVAFDSWAANLVEGDTNEAADVFLSIEGHLTRVSIAHDGKEPDGPSWNPSRRALDQTGQKVVFQSVASNLVPNALPSCASGFAPDTGCTHVYVRDLVANTTSLVSASSSGEPLPKGGIIPSISADGSTVVFSSLMGGFLQVYSKDLNTGKLTPVSARVGGGQGDGDSWWSSPSADGSLVAFQSSASNLVADDHNGEIDIFVAGPGGIILVSRSPDGPSANGPSLNPVLSANGEFVTFQSKASNLVSGDWDEEIDVFLARIDSIVRNAAESSLSSPGVPSVAAPSVGGGAALVTSWLVFALVRKR